MDECLQRSFHVPSIRRHPPDPPSRGGLRQSERQSWTQHTGLAYGQQRTTDRVRLPAIAVADPVADPGSRHAQPDHRADRVSISLADLN